MITFDNEGYPAVFDNPPGEADDLNLQDNDDESQRSEATRPAATSALELVSLLWIVNRET